MPPSDKKAEAGNETHEACVDGCQASCLQTLTVGLQTLPARIHPGAQGAVGVSQDALNSPLLRIHQHTSSTCLPIHHYGGKQHSF